MEKLNEREWKAIKLSDIYTNHHGKRLVKADRQSGKIPLLTAGEADNGVADFISNTEMPVYKSFISIDMFGNAFFHPYTATGDDNIYFFQNKDMTSSILSFTATCITKQKVRFSYGKQFRQPNADTQLVMLPVNHIGKPDYTYMMQYSAEMKRDMLMRYKTFIAGQLSRLAYKDIPDIKEKEWKPVAITDMFALVRGREGNMVSLDSGVIPLVSAKANNNGLNRFVSSAKKLFPGHCITLNNDGDGGAGLAYYQPASMALDTHVTALIPLRDMSKGTMLFIAECVSGLHGFFGHGLSISNGRAKHISIMLPTAASGEPDYEYMEQYAKNMMLRKYEQYLKFVERQESDVEGSKF